MATSILLTDDEVAFVQMKNQLDKQGMLVDKLGEFFSQLIFLHVSCFFVFIVKAVFGVTKSEKNCMAVLITMLTPGTVEKHLYVNCYLRRQSQVK